MGIGTKRSQLVHALAEKLKDINGKAPYNTDLWQQVEERFKFHDEIKDFPAVHINAGNETIVYEGGGLKGRYLSIIVRCYVKDEEDSVDALAALLEDIECVIDSCTCLHYVDRDGVTRNIRQLSIISIDTDEGVLDPLGVGEMQLEVFY